VASARCSTASPLAPSRRRSAATPATTCCRRWSRPPASATTIRARFEVGTAVAEEHDYVLSSGAFTVRPGIDDDAWEAHLHEVVAGLWAQARRGIAFNIMIRTPKPADPHVYTGNPEAWAIWCSQNLPGARVALRAGPPLDDFAVLVRRAPEP
jgi:hypothetical protein